MITTSGKNKLIHEQIAQRIHKERGAFERARKKKFLFLKNTGQLSQYYQQKAGIKVVRKTIKDYELTKRKISWWVKIINYVKKLLRYLLKRNTS